MIIRKSMPHIHFWGIMVIQKNFMYLPYFSQLIAVMINLEVQFHVYVKIALNGCNVFERDKPFDALGLLLSGCHCADCIQADGCTAVESSVDVLME